jgi:hypothetical protein
VPGEKIAHVSDEFRAALLAMLPGVDECAGLKEEGDELAVVKLTASDPKQFENATSRRENRRTEE